MMRASLFTILALLMVMPALSMIRTLPFPDLVKTSEVIVIATVATQEVQPGEKIAKTTTSLTVEKVLKGEIKTEEPLQFTTPGTREKPVLDRPVFPAKGERVLLFLVKNEEGTWRLQNGIQGLWPLETGTDKTLGMGFNYSIEKIEEELAKK